MLEIDLSQGRYEIVQHITENCAVFGNVSTVRLFLGSSPTAAVEMSTTKETEELALTLGGELVGNSAFIALVPLFHEATNFDWSANTILQS